MIRPVYLQSGDKVAILATAKKIEPGQIDGAIEMIRSWGLVVEVREDLYTDENQFAGSDAHRAQALQQALDDPEIRAVIFARGGYGTVRIIDQLDWTAFKKHPKWLCGFSDLTVLHSHVFENLGAEALHSSMPIFFADGEANAGSESLRQALFGKHESMTFGPHPLNRTGEVTGDVVGGNLSVLISIAGSVSEIDFTGKILFLEDLTEYLYHLDRMMNQLKRSGQLAGLKGLIIGQFTEMQDNTVPFGKTSEEIILDAIQEFDFPVAFNAPIGHVTENLAVYHGREVKLAVSDKDSQLLF